MFNTNQQNFNKAKKLHITLYMTVMIIRISIKVETASICLTTETSGVTWVRARTKRDLYMLRQYVHCCSGGGQRGDQGKDHPWPPLNRSTPVPDRMSMEPLHFSLQKVDKSFCSPPSIFRKNPC